MPLTADTPQPPNPAAPGVSFYAPYQEIPSGTAISPNPPKVFTPVKMRNLELPNRIWCAPMCMYSTETGALTPFHIQHLGNIAFRGAGLTIVEATAVVPEGRISAQDTGLWSDDQIAGLVAVVEFIHSQNKKIAIQLAHAGRKASTIAPWLGGGRGKSILAGPTIGGWPDKVVAPAAIPWDEAHANPRELTIPEIKRIVEKFVEATRRALKAGVDSIQIHSAHGYLLHEFLSGVSNTRTDEYGGSFENRIRLLLEVYDAIRRTVGEDFPVMIRISSTDWLDEEKYPNAWKVEDTIRLAKILNDRGVDLLDVSSAGNHPEQKIAAHTNCQIGIAKEVKAALGPNARMLISAVGGIGDGKTAVEIVERGGADVVMVGRAFLRDSGFVQKAAEQVGVKLQWPLQYHRRGGTVKM